MLNELDLLSQNINRLIEISNLYRQELLELKQKFAHTCMALEQIRSEHETLSEERNALHSQHDILAAKITEVQVQLKAILEDLPRCQTHDHNDQLMLCAPISTASTGENA